MSLKRPLLTFIGHQISQTLYILSSPNNEHWSHQRNENTTFNKQFVTLSQQFNKATRIYRNAKLLTFLGGKLHQKLELAQGDKSQMLVC